MSDGWWIVALVAVLLVIGVALRPRHGGGPARAGSVPRPGERMVRLDGPPVTREMQLLFAAYGGSEVTGVVQLQEGLRVVYRSGLTMTFVPVPESGFLYTRAEDGRVAVHNG